MFELIPEPDDETAAALAAALEQALARDADADPGAWWRAGLAENLELDP